MERLRITPSPLHTPQQTAELVIALDSAWKELGLKRVADYTLEGGRAGVGAQTEKPVNLWTPEQLVVKDGKWGSGISFENVEEKIVQLTA